MYGSEIEIMSKDYSIALVFGVLKRTGLLLQWIGLSMLFSMLYNTICQGFDNEVFDNEAFNFFWPYIKDVTESHCSLKCCCFSV